LFATKSQKFPLLHNNRTPEDELLVAISPQPAYLTSFPLRPLNRIIQRLIQDPLPRMVLVGEVGPGTRIVLDADGGELVLRATAVEVKTDPARRIESVHRQGALGFKARFSPCASEECPL